MALPLLFGAGCASTGKPAHAAAQPIIRCPGPSGEFQPPREPQVSILQVSEEDTTLRLKYTYRGSCKPHRLDLCWDGGMLTSSPGQVRMWLLHDAQGDTCEDVVTEERVFDTALLRRVDNWQIARCETLPQQSSDVVGCYIGPSWQMEELRRNPGAK